MQVLDMNAGLSSQEVKQRRKMHGYNEFEVKEDEPMYKKYLQQFQDPLILMLLCSAALSLLMRQFDDAFSITAAICIVVTVGFVQEYRSEKTLKEMTKILPPECHVLRDSKPVKILAKNLVPGDVVLLNTGDRVPADIRLMETVQLTIDESSFTGETTPAEKTCNMLNPEHYGGGTRKPDICDRRNVAFMGTMVCAGKGRGIVINTAQSSEFGHVFTMMSEEDRPKTPLQKNMDLLGKKLSIVSLSVIGVIGFIGWVQGKPIWDTINIAISLAVAAIPEGLPIVVTVTLALGTLRMSKRKAIVRKLPTVETLGCVNVLCTDKTGTLTQNKMTATDAYSSDNERAYVATNNAESSFVLSASSQSMSPYDSSLLKDSSPAFFELIQAGVLCNNATYLEDSNTYVGSPMETAMLNLAQKVGLDKARSGFIRLNEIPFNSEHKWMAVKTKTVGDSKTGDSSENLTKYYVKGASEVILERCCSTFKKSGVSAMSASEREKLLIEACNLAKSGLRVLSFASGEKLDKLTFHGFVGFIDPPRPGIKDTIQKLKYAGIELKMITGDSKETAEAVTMSLGMLPENQQHCKSLSGTDLDSLEKHELFKQVASANVYYRVSPRHKLEIVKLLQEHNYIVGMTGDGVNDAAALKRANIGVAMGISGTDVSKEAADMILSDDDLSSVVAAVEEGKAIFNNIRNFVTFQLSTSIAALSLIALSTILDMPNPLNAMQILWINIIMDGPPAQSLGVEPPDESITKSKKPRKATEPIINKTVFQRVLLSATCIVTGTLYVFYRETEQDPNGHRHTSARDTTMTFTCFVFFDMINAWTCRSQTQSVFKMDPFANKPFLYAVSGSVISQFCVIYIPFFQNIFVTEALYFSDILFLLLIASSICLSVSGGK